MSAVKWTAFPDASFEVSGLPWFAENSPELWRLPKRMEKVVRPPVWELAMCPSGGRIRFSSDTTTLALRLEYCRYRRHAEHVPYRTVGHRGLCGRAVLEAGLAARGGDY